MRWLIFVLAILPNLVSADKAARDEFIETATYLFKCSASLAPFDPNYSAPNYQNETDKFTDNQLIMQFEIDETFYSKDNLAALATSILKIEDEKISGLLTENTFSEDEKSYLIVKFMNIEAELETFVKQLLENPKFHADFIMQCAQSHDLTE